MLSTKRIVILIVACLVLTMGQNVTDPGNATDTANTTDPANVTDPVPNPPSSTGSDLSTLLRNSYALNAPPVDCTAQSSVFACNATTECYWQFQTANGTTAEGCVAKQNATYDNAVTAAVEISWCYQYFPAPFITSIYFLGSLLFGGSCSGLFYHAKYFNVYTIVLDTGERVFNTNYYKTWKWNIYLFILVGSTGIMAVTTFMNWMNESSCIYIYGVFLFCAALVLPFILVPLWFLGVLIYEKLKGVVRRGVDIDDYCRPVTKVPAQDPTKCQVRMM